MGGRFPRRRQGTLDEGKAPLEFQIGAPQRGFWIGAEMAREIDGREQQVTGLGGGLAWFSQCQGGLDLVGFLADFRQHRRRVVPVEADLAGLLLVLGHD